MSKLWIGADRTRFVDAAGRHVILRGVNLGGDCKLPYPDGGTDRPSDFSDHATISFIGRPFPPEEMDEHLGRIAGWGFNVLRLLVTWEAVEHAGPGQHDRAYIDYIGSICERAAHFGLAVFIDFHQDAWSRMSGGSGAPCWVFDKLGIDYTKFDAAGAAHVMQYRYDYNLPEKRQEDRYATMSWPLNYRLPVNGIMWTAFFAGRTFTPDWKIDGINVQDFLQGHYLECVRAVAQRVRELPNVLGFDSLNEPGMGWIGHKMTERPSGNVSGDFAVGLTGPAWTPLDGLKVARGIPTSIPHLTIEKNKLAVARQIVANRSGVSIWSSSAPDPFEVAGAWQVENGEACAPDENFFRMRNGKLIQPEQEFLQPFFSRMADAIRSVRADWLLFAEINPHVITQGRSFPLVMPQGSVNASHWYDVNLLVSKRFKPDLSEVEKASLRERYTLQLGYLRMLGERINGGAPTLIGECGIPYDINEGEAFRRWADGEHDDGVWQAQETALSLMYDVLDDLLLNSTQWNYTASNRNDLRVGDGWNQEDLSIFSRDQQSDPSDPDSGARALRGYCRPYVRCAQGTLKDMHYAASEGSFTATIDVDSTITATSEIYLPRHFTQAPSVQLSRTASWSFDASTRLLRVTTAESGTLSVNVTAA